MEEEELVKKARKRDKKAFGQLYDKYLPAIYRFIFLKTSKRTISEDLSHQTFLNAWQHIENYEIRHSPFSSWLYKIARHLVIDYYRSKKDFINLDKVPEIVASEEDEIEEKIDQDIELTAIKIAIKNLKESEQSVIIMKFVEGLSNKEIAFALGKREGAIRVVQYRAIKNIKKILEKNGRNSQKPKKA